MDRLIKLFFLTISFSAVLLVFSVVIWGPFQIHTGSTIINLRFPWQTLPSEDLDIDVSRPHNGKNVWVITSQSPNRSRSLAAQAAPVAAPVSTFSPEPVSQSEEQPKKAGVFRCEYKDGKTIFSDEPCDSLMGRPEHVDTVTRQVNVVPATPVIKTYEQPIYQPAYQSTGPSVVSTSSSSSECALILSQLSAYKNANSESGRRQYAEWLYQSNKNRCR